MLGAIAGDIAGSTREWNRVDSRHFPLFPAGSRFTDDTVLTVAEIRPAYSFDVSCQGSVPEAIVAFLGASDVEGAIRDAIWLGGDADTQAAIAGSLAEAWHGGVSAELRDEARRRLSDDLLDVTDRFAARYMNAPSGDS